MASIIKIVMLYYLCLQMDMTQAIGCNEKSSQCIKEIKDYSSVEAFQKMFCPIQTRFWPCWSLCTAKEKVIHHRLFLNLRLTVDLCSDIHASYTNESLEIAKCVTGISYQEYLKCSDRTDAGNRSPSKRMAPNQGFINASIIKYCINSTVVEEKCGPIAYDMVESLKHIILPNMNEYEAKNQR